MDVTHSFKKTLVHAYFSKFFGGKNKTKLNGNYLGNSLDEKSEKSFKEQRENLSNFVLLDFYLIQLWYNPIRKKVFGNVTNLA